MQRIILSLIGLFILAFPSKGVTINLSQEAEISVLTCGPSELVHAIYGHTAVRVKDSRRMLDVVFNYGVFSFNAPNFVYRFAKGQTDYMLAAERFSDFYEDYKRHGRSIDEQVLNLSQLEKQQMMDFLIDNAKPENREYRYNFFFDNCATRVRDLVENQVDGTIIFPEGKGQDKTFRQHASDYQQVLPWTNFGIQLTLGSPSDEVASAYQEMFLPDYLMNHFAGAQIKKGNESRPLVKETHTIYDAGAKKHGGFNLFAPFVVLSVLVLVVLLISLRQFRKNKISYWLDYILLFVSGITGLVLLWFVIYSEHPAMHPNYNLLWAVPVNLPFMFAWMVKKWRLSLKWYWPALSVWLFLFLVFGFWVPQAYPVGFYLITLMVLCRALFHSVRFFRISRL